MRRRVERVEIGQEAVLAQQRQRAHLGAGEERAALVHRIRRLAVRDDALVGLRVDEHLREREDRLLRAVRRDELRVRVERRRRSAARTSRAAASRSSGRPAASGYGARSGSASTSAWRIIGSVGSFGSPLPKSITLDALRGERAAAPPRAARTDRSPSRRASGLITSDATEERAQRLERARRGSRRAPARPAVCAYARRARAVVDRVDALLGELRDRRPRLLRRDVGHELAQPRDERVRQRRRRGRRVAEDLELAARHELAQPRLRLVARAARRVAVVELDARASPGRRSRRCRPRRARRSRPRGRRARRARRRAARGRRAGASPRDELVDRVHARPRPRRVRALAVERRRAPGCCRGSRRGGCSRSARARRRARRRRARPLAKSAGSGLSVDRHLLAREEEVARRARRRARARSSRRRRPSCRSRRARAPRRPRSGPGCCPAPGSCRDARRARPGAGRRRGAPRRRRKRGSPGTSSRTSSTSCGLGAALRGDVDELERPGGEVGRRARQSS